MKNTKPPQLNYLNLSIIVLLLIYVVVRAFLLSFTHDESFNYLHWVSRPVKEILNFGNFHAIEPANNHILNTLLAKFFGNLFGPKEIFLRLPSILAYALYLFASYKLVNRLKPIFSTIGLIFLNFNPFLLDFFSLSRGYALALALMLTSLVFLKQGLEQKSTKLMFSQFFLSLGTAGISCLANLTFMYFYICLSLTIALYLIIVYRLKYSAVRDFFVEGEIFQIFSLTNIFLMIYSVATIPYLVPTYLKLRVMDNFFAFGGTKGFIPETMYSLINASLYEKFYFNYLSDGIVFGIIFFIVLSAFVFGSKFINNKFSGQAFIPLSYLIIVLLITGLSIGLNVASQVKFLIERTAILFLPLLALILTHLFDYLASYQFRKIHQFIVKLVILLVTSAIIYHTLNSANLTHCFVWKYDADTKKMVQNLEAVVSKEYGTQLPSQSISLGISWVFEPTINFYRISRQLDWLKEVTRDDLTKTNDYYYYLPSDEPLVMNRRIVVKNKFETTGNLFGVQL